jgi:hypothetical protein
VGKCIFFGNIENTIFGVASSSISDGISKLKKPKKKKEKQIMEVTGLQLTNQCCICELDYNGNNNGIQAHKICI